MMSSRNADTIPTQCAVRRRTTHIRAFGGEGARNLEYDDVARIPLFHGVDLRLYFHDILDRVDKIESVDGLSQWEYDTKALGKLSLATSAFGIQTDYDYDELTRLRDTTWTVHGETFQVTTTYDALDRVDTLAYPEVAGLGRTTMPQKYNAYGYVERIDDVSPGQQGKTIWQVKERNHDGELVRSVTGDKLATTNAYDELTGQVEGIRVQAPNGGEVYHVGMLYDQAGRMEARTDYVENRQESFVHDDLSRLRQWTLQSPGNGVQTSVYSYDRLSSLEKVERNGVEQQHYAHGNNGRPRAIQHDHQPLGAYAYDDRGRVLHGGERSLAYTDFDLPTSVTTSAGTTLFEYDAANQRELKTSPDEKTIYIGGVYERRESASGAVHVFHIGAIADIVYDANAVIPRETLYVHGDALGSTSLVTDAMGNERERLFYAPFGARVDIDGNPPTGPPSDRVSS